MLVAQKNSFDCVFAVGVFLKTFDEKSSGLDPQCPLKHLMKDVIQDPTHNTLHICYECKPNSIVIFKSIVIPDYTWQEYGMNRLKFIIFMVK